MRRSSLHKVKISILLCPLLISEVSLKTMEENYFWNDTVDNLATEKKSKSVQDTDKSETPSIRKNSPEHMGLATSHHAFPLCPAKLIQE